MYNFNIKNFIMEKQILLNCISPDELKQLIKEVIKEEFMDFKKNHLFISAIYAGRQGTFG